MGEVGLYLLSRGGGGGGHGLAGGEMLKDMPEYIFCFRAVF